MLKKIIVVSMLAASFAAVALAKTANSGLRAGEFVTPFEPTHVTGPLKGTNSCPPCTYGVLPQVQVWVNADKAENVAALAKLLNDATEAKKDAKLRTFVIFVTDSKHTSALKDYLPKLAERVGNSVHIAYIDRSDEALANYKINTAADVKNTVIVYKNRKVTETFVNLSADAKGKVALTDAINKITG
jgi:hypothetical protein